MQEQYEGEIDLWALESLVFRLDSGLHQDGMSNDEDGRRSDQPKEGRYWRSEPEQRKTDNEEGDVEGFLRDDLIADLDGFRCYMVSTMLRPADSGGLTVLVDEGEAAEQEEDGYEQDRVKDASRSANTHLRRS